MIHDWKKTKRYNKIWSKFWTSKNLRLIKAYKSFLDELKQIPKSTK